MPKQINTASVGQRLVQLFSLKGRFQPVLDEVIVPVVSVDPEGVERRPAAGFKQQSGVAAEYTYITLFNPANSGLLMRPTRLSIISAATTYVYITMGFLARSTALQTQWTDERLAGSPEADAGVGTSPVSISGSSSMVFQSTAAMPLVREFSQVVIEPGNGFLAMFSVANTTGLMSLEWTEQSITADGYR